MTAAKSSAHDTDLSGAPSRRILVGDGGPMGIQRQAADLDLDAVEAKYVRLQSR